MMKVMMIILLLSLLLHICDSISSDMTIEKCQEIGFNSTDLECKNCNSLERIIGISEPGNVDLVNECKSCCTNKIVADEQYEYAVLEVDKRFISFYPNVDAIVTSIKGERKSKQKLKKELKKKGGSTVKTDIKFDIEIKYRFGSSPQLLLYKAKTKTTPPKAESKTSSPGKTNRTGAWTNYCKEIKEEHRKDVEAKFEFKEVGSLQKKDKITMKKLSNGWKQLSEKEKEKYADELEE